MKKILSGAILILVAGVLALQIDDDLDPRVLAFLDKTKTTESDAYYYLLGMPASAEDDPVRVGREIYKSIRQAEEKYFMNPEEFDFDDYPLAKKLRLPEGDLFCKSWEAGCLAGLFRSKENFEKWISDYQVLLKRYDKFLGFEEYATLSRPMIAEPRPEYWYLMKANRLVVLESIGVGRRHDYPSALSMLSDNIKRLRGQLARQDTMIGKLVLLMQISENIDVTYVISKKAKPEDLFTIPRLSLQERDFEVPMAREFAMMFYEYTQLECSSSFFRIDRRVPCWLDVYFLKPNIMLNVSYPEYARTVEYSRLSHEQFVTRIEGDVPIPIKLSNFRNPIGNVLLRVGYPDYNGYLSRFYDLDAKIALYNALVGYGDVNTHLSESINPYYPDDKFASLSSDGSKVCFDGPLPDTRNLRCLPENIDIENW